MVLTFVLSYGQITLLLVLVIVLVMSENSSSIFYCHFYMFLVLKTLITLLLLVYLLGIVNKCLKNIVLKNIFRNILGKNKKVTSFFLYRIFYISHKIV